MEQIAQDLRTMIRTPLSDAHVAALHEAGEVKRMPAGTMVQHLGQPYAHFIYVVSGEVEALDPTTGERYGDGAATLGPGQYFGETGFLAGAKAMLGARTVQDSEILFVPRETMLALMSQIPEMSDIIITVFSARRRRQLESNQSTLTLIGADVDRDIRMVEAFASRNRIPYRLIDLEDAAKDPELEGVCPVKPQPMVVWGKDTVISPPTAKAVAAHLGLDIDPDEIDGQVFDVLIVGGGPSGVAAGVYAGAEGMSALVLEDLAVGGQAGTSSRIENYMGFPTGISGGDLCWRGEVQAMKFGTRFAVPLCATHVSIHEDGHFLVDLEGGGEVCATALVVATGVQYRRLPIEGLERLEGAGIYYAATEAEARYCQNTHVVVIGGGNSAGQAAMYLSRSAAHVHLLVRGSSLAASMSDYLSSRLEADPRITIHYQTELSTLRGDTKLEGITVVNKAENTTQDIETCGLFIMVGAAPNTGWLADLVALDDKGFVLTGRDAGGRWSFETSQPGVFAVGDVRAGSVKRVASSVGEGSVVISDVWNHINR